MRATPSILCVTLAFAAFGCAKTVSPGAFPDGGAGPDAPIALDVPVVSDDRPPGFDLPPAPDTPTPTDVPVGTRCFANVDCDDRIFCNGEESCVDGRCARATPINCDDGLACTTDLCDEANRTCRNAPDDARCPAGGRCDVMRGCVIEGCASDAACDDGDPCNGAESCRVGICARGIPPVCDNGRFCDGAETCQRGVGCVRGMPPRCEATPCGAGVCDERTRSCVVAGGGGDGDGDGFASTMCGGNDCDDRNPAVNPGARELCNNGLDDNCDGRSDCAEPACNIAPNCMSGILNDTCATAVPVGIGTLAVGNTAGARNDYTPVPQGFPGCAGGAGPDVVYALGIRRAAVVTIDVRARGWDPVLHVRREPCATGTQVACNDDRNGLDSQVTFSAEVGTYYVVVDGFSEGAAGSFELSIREGAPPAEVCTNRFDDDGDGLIDCADSDCAMDPACTCVPAPENDARSCSDGVDNDCDRQGDCADPECAATPACCRPTPPREYGVAACTDGVDNDCDGTADCNDSDCRPSRAANAECCNGRDENGNGLVDEFACACESAGQCRGVGAGAPFPSDVCWVNTFRVCAPSCNLLGGNAFCSNFFTGTRCDAMTGECR